MRRIMRISLISDEKFKNNSITRNSVNIIVIVDYIKKKMEVGVIVLKYFITRIN